MCLLQIYIHVYSKSFFMQLELYLLEMYILHSFDIKHLFDVQVLYILK
jgi:hypothetical protein